MRRAYKIALIGASALASLVVIALLYMQFADLGMWIGHIERKISASSGYDVAIDGSLQLDIGAETAVSLATVSVAKPAAATASPFLNIANLRVELDTWSLFRGPIRVVGIDVSDTDIDLMTDQDGINNWQPDATATGDPEVGQAPLFDQINLANIRISYNDERVAVLEYATLNYANERIQILDSRVATEPGLIDFKGEADIADSGKPKVTATIVSPALNFVSTAPAEEAAPAEADEASSASMFSDEPLEYSWLNAFDLDAEVRVDLLSAAAERVENLSATIALDRSALRVTPLTFTKDTGTFAGELRLEPVDDEFSLHVSFVAEQIRMSALAADGQDPGTVPPLDLTAEISGSGRTMHEIAASSSGQLSGKQHSGLVNMQDSGFLFSDIVTSVFRAINPLAESEPFAELECSIIEVEIENGVATIDELAAQLDRLVIVGSGNVDLETEELDLTIRTKTREGLGLSLGGVVNSLLAVGGTIREPALNLDPAGSVTTAGAAVATGGMSVLAKGLWDRLSAEADICNTDAN